MIGRFVVTVAMVLTLGQSAAVAQYQQYPAPVPLYPGAAPRTYDQEALPPVAPAPPPAPDRGYSDDAASPSPPPYSDRTDPAVDRGPPVPPPLPDNPAGPVLAAPATDRVFCTQPVTVHVAERASVPEKYRPFIGIWSDASWTPQLCAALVVENVRPDGTATIVYAFGPMGSTPRPAGGVLHGTGIIKDGELRFQNSDGSQYAFRPLYSDLNGRLTTPQGQSLGAIFKRAL